MFQYCVKRIMLMIPTFFVVSVVIFVVLNLAPGRPGQLGEQGLSSVSEAAGASESYRIFKEQFNLDKPAFFNTRFTLDRADVRARLETVVAYDRARAAGALKPSDDAGAALSGGQGAVPTIREVIAAQEELEDWGQVIVPLLVDIAANHQDPDVRWFATRRLTVNARRRLIHEFHAERQDDATRILNSAIDRENAQLAAWSYARDADDATRAEVTGRWVGWLDANRARFSLGAWDKVQMALFDTRFARYWSNLIQLDLGVSHIDRKPVLGKILGKLKYSLTLSLSSVVLIYLIAVPLGVFSAVRQGSKSDQAITVTLFMLYSLPSFFTGVLLLQLLAIGPEFTLWASAPPPDMSVEATEQGVLLARTASVLAPLVVLGVLARRALGRPELRTGTALMGQAVLVFGAFVGASLVAQVALFGSVDMFPAGGFEQTRASRDLTTLEHLVDIAHHLVLPVFCLTYGGLASLSRYARSGLLDIIRSDYIRTARAKGLSEPVVVIKHATRNGMIPVLTLLGSFLPLLIGGSVIIEIIFNIPGMGLFLYEAITQQDYNVVMGVLLISSVLTLIGLLLSDISYALVDPRISFD